MTENVLRRFARIDKSNITPAIVLAALCLILAVISPTFRTQDNLVNILQQVTINAIIAVGMTLVIFTGGVDLSVGSVLGLSGIVMGIMIVDNKMSPLIAVPVAIALGAACGFVNGILISKLKLQPMIATLAMMSMARGAALTLANGKTITGYSKEFTWIGQGTIPGTGIPVQTLLITFSSPYLGKGWPLFGKPDLPLEISVRLGRLFPAQKDIVAFTAQLEEYFRAELGPSGASTATGATAS